MWHRFGAVAMGCLLGCSDGAAPEPPPGETAMESPNGEEPDAQLPALGVPAADGPGVQLAVAGWEEAVGAKALLNVIEGVSDVHLLVTGGGVQDVVILEVNFESVSQSMGSHRVDVGMPYTESDSAIASLDGLPYHSQGGHIEVSLNAQGDISGSFDVDLAEDPTIGEGLPIMFTHSDEVRSLRGRFAGRWELLCQSRLDGHQSLAVGGAYCDTLVF